ncbi:hypothetical protein V6N11_045360 [Hibiscus sabdariffa]|uniref:Uncharacterized protein n=1 Tax=Hibiscus sabdariffa TaxID=183260 RepID=A0ABR2Q1B4_9ROSI
MAEESGKTMGLDIVVKLLGNLQQTLKEKRDLSNRRIPAFQDLEGHDGCVLALYKELIHHPLKENMECSLIEKRMCINRYTHDRSFLQENWNVAHMTGPSERMASIACRFRSWPNNFQGIIKRLQLLNCHDFHSHCMTVIV